MWKTVWRIAAAICVVAALVCSGLYLVASSEAAPLTGSGSFLLAAPPDQATILDEEVATHVGITINVTDGEARVEVLDGEVIREIGDVPAHTSRVFEGEYSEVRVRAMAPGTAGAYEIRSPIGDPADEYLVGSATSILVSDSVQVYRSEYPGTRRVISIKNTGLDVLELRKSSDGDVLMRIQSGSTYFYNCTASAFWLTGSSTADIVLQEAKEALPLNGAWKIPKSRPCEDPTEENDEYDDGFDSWMEPWTPAGTACLVGHITCDVPANHHVKVKVTYANGTTSTLTMPDGGEDLAVLCSVAKVEAWTKTDASHKLDDVTLNYSLQIVENNPED